MTSETCDECAFDGDRWSDDDVLTTLPKLGALLDGFVDGARDDVLQTRATPQQWSIAEYADHVRETLFGMRFLAGTALSAPGTDLGEPPEPRFAPHPRTVDVNGVVAAVQSEGQLLSEELATVDRGGWTTSVVVGGERVDLRWIGRHAVHDALHHLHDIGRIRYRLEDGVTPGMGTVVGLHRSGGGVPKAPIGEADVGWSGLVGDEQADRRHHGRPFQALCLWSAEVITALADEGHPIHPGAAGENITIGGVDWATLRPGVIIRVGGVVAELSSYTTPCAKNAQWFVGGDSDRMHQARYPGWSRLYARVLQPGSVVVGDVVEIEPDL